MRMILALAGVLMILSCSKARRPTTTLKAKSYPVAEISGGIPPAEVGAMIRRKKPDLKSCHEALTKKRSGAKGRIVVEFDIQGDTGQVIKATLVQNQGLKDKAFQSCVLKVVRGMVFGKMQKHQGTNVIYPLSFPLN